MSLPPSATTPVATPAVPVAATDAGARPTLLFVDDEPQSCKWFARTFSDEFDVVCADGVDAALALLHQRGAGVALLVTDYRMPHRTGLELLLAAQRDHRHVVRLLVTAFAEKDVAIAAVNQGQVFRILEKPLDLPLTRATLHEAMALYRAQALERALQENRMIAIRETLGFLAHELNTPLVTVRGFVAAVAERYQAPPTVEADGSPAQAGLACFSERRAGEVMEALAGAQRGALYCQSLVSAFVRSAREVYPGVVGAPVTAGNLVQALLKEYPFEGDERGWVESEVQDDFVLPGQRDLLFLVLSTLTKNALLALHGRTDPRLRIVVSREAAAPGAAPRPGRPWIRFVDNGHGIAPEVLERLTHEPVTTRAASGGNGMGLMFCRRVLQSLGGSIVLESEPDRGTTVSLHFKA
ncbi:MAG: hypothetical protein OJF60_000606 [Burkholderiaceae bacterium]|nr:MAG: hypothetical protein OJF60_000606 [Burkholderiaceae bacterium]